MSYSRLWTSQTGGQRYSDTLPLAFPAHSLSWLRAVATNIRLGWRCLPRTNTLAYRSWWSVTKEKSLHDCRRIGQTKTIFFNSVAATDSAPTDRSPFDGRFKFPTQSQSQDALPFGRQTIGRPIFDRLAWDWSTFGRPRLTDVKIVDWPLADRLLIDRHLTDGHFAKWHLPDGHLANGHWANGHLANGHLANGHLANGHLANGHLANGLGLFDNRH